MAALAYLFCIYSTLPWLFGRPYSGIWSAIVFPVNSTVWSLLLTLVIWLCITKNGSLVGSFLQWTPFRPLSRLTYSVYLTHAWTVWVYTGTRRNLIDLNSVQAVQLLMAIVVISYVVAFFFTIIFESPLIRFIEYLKDVLLKQHMAQMAARMNSIEMNGDREKMERLTSTHAPSAVLVAKGADKNVVNGHANGTLI